jgi:formate dehydrogenase subunit delta
MNINHLIRMANQIGDFFESMPDQNEARREIATHLRRFWEPRMRRQLISSVESKENLGLKQIVLEALNENKADLM